MTPVEIALLMLWGTFCASVFVLIAAASISLAYTNAYRSREATRTARDHWLKEQEGEQP